MDIMEQKQQTLPPNLQKKTKLFCEKEGAYYTVAYRDRHEEDYFRIEKELVGQLYQSGCQSIIFRSLNGKHAYTTDINDWIENGEFFKQSELVFLPKSYSYITYE